MGEERNHEPDTSDIDNEDAQLAMQFDGYDVERERVPAALITPAPSVLDPRSPPPMIRRVWMRNFKGYKEFEVALGRFNVLVGTNNSGKSTLLQAVDLLFALLKLHAENDRLATSGRLLPPSILPLASLRDLFHNGIWRAGNRYVFAIIGAEFADGSSVELD